MELIEIYDRMRQCVESKSVLGFHEALFDFLVISLAVSDNQLLSKILSDLMPNIKRLQYLSILLKTDKMKQNVEFFRTIVDCLENQEVERGVAAMHDYVMAEKEFVLSEIGSSPYSSYLED